MFILSVCKSEVNARNSKGEWEEGDEITALCLQHSIYFATFAVIYFM